MEAFVVSGCTPLRPSYAPDLQDAALAAANLSANVLQKSILSLHQTEIGCNVMGRLYEW
jgi:hypothetical protein